MPLAVHFHRCCRQSRLAYWGNHSLARYIADLTHDACHAVRLENDHVTVTMLPEIGGKIVEIVDQGSGRNWLWSNAGLPHRLALGTGGYETRLDSGGWDEILLSVAPGLARLKDGTLIDAPDHGDLVGRPWQRVAAGVDDRGSAYCELRASGRAADYALRRRLVLEHDRPRLRIEYCLENTGAASLPFFWCAHPLLAAERGMRILLPAGLACRLESVDGTPAAIGDGAMRWPLLPAGGGRVVDVSCCADPSATGAGVAAKIFVRTSESPHVAVESADGQGRLLLTYDLDTIPWLGIWINDRGWTGTCGRPYLNLGLEPSTASRDSLAQAIARDEVPILGPGESRRWWLQLTLQYAQRDRMTEAIP